MHELTNFVVNSLDMKLKPIAIFLDLAKAFDTVSVPILIKKLENIGIRGEQLNLFKSYLSDRTQCIRINSHLSDELPITFGVPQGSILGPTLFLIYINELCNMEIPMGRIITFADDTVLLFKEANTWEEAFSLAQLGLNTVVKWLNENVLTLIFFLINYIFHQEPRSLTISYLFCSGTFLSPTIQPKLHVY